MNFRPNDEAQHEFQIAPLIDIVFLLLIFFIATYALAQIERELDVKLPDSKSAEQQVSRLNDLVVNIGPDGNIVVNRQALETADLLQRLQRLATFGTVPNVIIRADEACQHKFVVRVMDVCAAANVQNIYFSTRREESAHAPAP